MRKVRRENYCATIPSMTLPKTQTSIIAEIAPKKLPLKMGF